MADGISQTAELTIEYCDYDEYDIRSNEVNVKITVEGDEWTIDADGFENAQTFRVIEERDKIMVAPIVDGPTTETTRTTTPAEYEPGTGRLEPRYLKHNDKYIDAIVGDVIDETLGDLVSDARERFVSKRGIQSATNFDLPDIELEVQEGQPLFPTSKSGKSVAPRNRLVVEPVDESETYERWHDAIVETCNRYQVWAGNSAKNTGELLAPPNSENGETLTLTEYLDAWYTVDPREVAEAAAIETDPSDEINVNRDVDDLTDLEASKEVTGTLERSGGTMELSVVVTISVEWRNTYHDSRLAKSIEATFDVGDSEIKTSLRRGLDLNGNISSYTARPTGLPDDIYDQLTEESSCEEFGITTLRIDNSDAEIIAAIEEEIGGAVDTDRNSLRNEHEMEVSVDRQWESGEGEGHAVHAEGTVTFADGRELPIHWRNAVDIGHQVFTGEDGGSGSNLPEFEDPEIDAAVSLARDESPITRAIRM